MWLHHIRGKDFEVLGRDIGCVEIKCDLGVIPCIWIAQILWIGVVGESPFEIAFDRCEFCKEIDQVSCVIGAVALLTALVIIIYSVRKQEKAMNQVIK